MIRHHLRIGYLVGVIRCQWCERLLGTFHQWAKTSASLRYWPEPTADVGVSAYEPDGITTTPSDPPFSQRQEKPFCCAPKQVC
ncbi:hypothetical protein [Candidatus Methylacidithermus pantelleriae]|uniref:Uncharacterized protein n=1 Tax=Candidatus Methylacidithermus pantelleriae TaxID=2744239 RepID=A0A8J2FR72_9BACT|nr:hypothetical protein [Candidatus Methylacidithermus pantelleriae]CAF0688944.1 hypothetical protein MPNT_10059 [Candidatus Methylacidithermus pantelleriae]